MEEVYLSGYVASIEPKIHRGLIEYRLRIVSRNGYETTAYLRNPPQWLRLGIPVDVKASKIKGIDGEVLLIEEIKKVDRVAELEISRIVIEEIMRGKFMVISGKRDGKIFSIPIYNERLISKLEKNAPIDVYGIFLESETGLMIIEIISKKEYNILKNLSKFLSEISKNERKNMEIVDDMLKKIRGHKYFPNRQS